MSRTNTYVTRLKTGMQKVVSSGAKRLRSIRWRPVAIGAGALAIVAAGAGTVWMYRSPDNQVVRAAESLRNAVAEVLPKRSVAELEAAVKANPTDGELLVALGDAQFEKAHRGPALHSYDRALELKAKPSEAMLQNLAACLGTKNHDAAVAIVTSHKLVAAADGFHAQTSHREHKVRWAAIDVLQRLQRVQHNDYVRAWTRDLSAEECRVRRNAVVNLGRFGNRSTLAAIRAADEKDEKETPWYGVTCLGNRAEEAQTQILAKK